MCRLCACNHDTIEKDQVSVYLSLISIAFSDITCLIFLFLNSNRMFWSLYDLTVISWYTFEIRKWCQNIEKMFWKKRKNLFRTALYNQWTDNYSICINGRIRLQGWERASKRNSLCLRKVNWFFSLAWTFPYEFCAVLKQ